MTFAPFNPGASPTIKNLLSIDPIPLTGELCHSLFFFFFVFLKNYSIFYSNLQLFFGSNNDIYFLMKYKKFIISIGANIKNPNGFHPMETCEKAMIEISNFPIFIEKKSSWYISVQFQIVINQNIIIV